MKRRFAVSAALAVLALGLTACSNGTAGSGSEAKGAVAMSYPRLSDVQIWQDTVDEMRPLVEAAGYELLSDDARGDVQRQMNNWLAWGARGDVKAVMGYAAEPQAAVPVTAQLHQNGMKVLAYATPWDGVDASMLLDNRADGMSVAQGVTAAAAGVDPQSDVQVALLTKRTSDFGNDRSNGMVDGIRKAWPNARISEVPYDSGRDSAYNATSAQLAAHPDTKIWVAIDNTSGLGMHQALVDFGMAADAPDYVLGALDASTEMVDQSLVPGSVWKSVWTVPAKDIAAANAKLLIAAAEGGAVEDAVVASVHITAENATDYAHG